MHQRGQVSQENIDKVNKIIKELGYKPNVYARNLALNKTFTFAVLLPQPKDLEYFKATVLGIEKAEEELHSFGVKVKYYFHNYSNSSFKTQAAKIMKDNVSAVVFAPLSEGSANEFTSTCDKSKLPYVLIDSNISEQKALTYIGQDAFQSGYLAAKLCDNKSTGKNILIVKIAEELESNSVLEQRIKGFRAYFSDKNPDVSLTETNIQNTTTQQLSKHINTNTLPTVRAVFVPNSRAHIVASHLQKNHLKVPLVGYDLIQKNISFLKSEYIDFLINQKPTEQGYKAVKSLYQALALKEDISPLLLMPLEIVVKENVDFSHS